MDQLKGKVVNVVLTIQEGKGMESIKNLMLISANFNGRILESDPVNAEDCPTFNTNLIWEINKKELRKIRSFNQPLRIECLSIDNQNRREKFGHVLLDLRSAVIVEGSNQQIPFKWHKLIGVRNKKRNCYPELYLSLTIRNHLDEAQLEESLEEIEILEPRLEGSIPIMYLEDGYIMVGDHSQCTEDFSLDILIKAASSLDLLLPEVLFCQHPKNKYHMSIKIFGIPIKTKQFSKKLHDIIIFEEKIVVRLLSNFEVLKQFFGEENFEIGFNCGNNVLGITTVSFDALANLNEKLMLTDCYFRFPSANGIVPVGNDGRKPVIVLEINLKKNKGNVSVIIPPLEIDISKACGDYSEKVTGELMLATAEQMQELEEWKQQQKEEQLRELEEWKEKKKAEHLQELEEWKNQQQEQLMEEQLGNMVQKTNVLDENIKKCKELQTELQTKLNSLKTLKSSTDLLDATGENQNNFVDCDKDLLVDYISNLQIHNENLKQIINEQKKEIESMQKASSVKEQTTNILQELQGLEEKFQQAQQCKMFLEEHWQRTYRLDNLCPTE